MESKNLFGAFVVGLALFAAWPFVWGKWQTVQALQDALASREVMVAERADALENLEREFTKFDENLAGDDAEKFAAMVPSQRETAEIISAIDTIAGGTGMSIIEVGLSEPVQRARDNTQASLKEVIVTIEMEGSYASFTSFLSQLEFNIRLFDVQTLEITQDRNRPGVQGYTLDAKAFFLP